MSEQCTITRRVIMHCYTRRSARASLYAIQLHHDDGYFEDLINLYINIPCVNKSLSSSLSLPPSADDLGSHGGVEHPLPSGG